MAKQRSDSGDSSSTQATASGQAAGTGASIGERREAAEAEARRPRDGERFVTGPGDYEDSLAANKDTVEGMDPHGIARGD